MINLLPPDIKENYRYARRNTRLVRWIFVFGFALVGLAGLSVGGIFYLDQTAESHGSQVATLEANLKQQNQAATQKQVKEISNDLKLAVQVLSKEVLFSQLLKQMATIIPKGAVLANLNIDQISGALDITADTTDYDAATQLQVNLADPANKIFSKADIVNISCTSATGSTEGSETAAGAEAEKYPCTVTVRALFAPDNPFLFISDSKAAKP